MEKGIQLSFELNQAPRYRDEVKDVAEKLQIKAIGDMYIEAVNKGEAKGSFAHCKILADTINKMIQALPDTYRSKIKLAEVVSTSPGTTPHYKVSFDRGLRPLFADLFDKNGELLPERTVAVEEKEKYGKAA